MAAPINHPIGSVALGQATISFSGTSDTIINQTSNKAVIDWQTFFVTAGGSMTFHQPSTTSVTLNRVTGTQASVIAGALTANGQVWIINGNGILFGSGSRINVGGLLATTADITDTNFTNGNYAFSGGTAASVVNQGTITASNGGSVVLSGSRVSNEGLIQADSGTIVLGGASAFTVDFDGDKLLTYAITSPAGQASDGTTGVSNSGTLQSNAGGRVIMTARAASAIADNVVNNSGMISATSAQVVNGEVVLDAGDGGTANIAGTVNASGSGQGQTGGTVAITGSTVNVADNTTIDASGNAGGGTVNIGGNSHGAGPLQSADNTTVGHATIKVDATGNGNGGTLVVYSNGLTDFSGIASAMGGLTGGNGGSVETSGTSVHVGSQAAVNTSASAGTTGTWLVDPTNLVIGGDVDPVALANSLATSNVTLTADNNLTIAAAVSANSANTLNLQAGSTLAFSAGLQNTGTGTINLAAAAITSQGSPVVAANTLNIAVSGSGGVGSSASSLHVAANQLNLTTQGGNAFLASSGGIVVTSAALSGGSLTLSAGGPITQTGAITGASLTVNSTSGAITLTNSGNTFTTLNATGAGAGTITAAGALALSGANFSGALTVNASGNVTQTAAIVASALNVTTTSGITLLNGSNSVSGAASFNAQSGVSFANSVVTTLGALSLGGDLTLLSKSSINLSTAIQNTAGNVTIVAGWDGTTTDSTKFLNAGVFGNSSGNVTIAGVAVGSKMGTTTIAAANLTLDGSNGFAQLGYNGAGSGNITVGTTGAVTLSGGGTGHFAQIGNGGLSVTGNNSGNIQITAGGDVTLNGGSGSQAYAQIGHGGALSNTSTSGYSNTGTIAVTAADVLLNAGAGSAAYAQIGHGGYLAGQNLTGTGTNSGNVTVTAAHTINLTGGGADAYAQIGNGGDQNNRNPSAAAGGTDGGVVMALAPNGPSGSINLRAGSGANSYAQIGNGGQAANAGAAAVSSHFTITGNVSVTDLLLAGSNTGANGYSQIGNGDASLHSVGNITGDVAIDANGAITYIPGTAPGAGASIGDFTGFGTVSFTLTGVTTTPTLPNFTGTVVYLDNLGDVVTYKPISTVGPLGDGVYVSEGSDGSGAPVVVAQGPIEKLTTENGGQEVVVTTSTDNATQVVANSLDGSHKPHLNYVVIPNLLTQVVGNLHEGAVPASAVSAPSWGNEAFWQ